MATAKNVSPGAALLRSSRMFSMPAPISAPSDLSMATKHKSATATTPFPTHLTVTTPQASRLVGDWGFKRPFPLKTTTKSTLPLVRVRKVDSIEHVTDFRSASDHAITLKKFQEMNLDFTVPQKDDQRPPKSVFEEDADVTALTPEERVKKENIRWRFNGPWLAGMTDGEFNEYLSSTVRGKRTEFRAYLKAQLAADMTNEQNQQAQERAEEAPVPVQSSDISETAFTEHLRQLRQDPVMLFQHVSRFLDLAPLAPEEAAFNRLGALRPNKRYTFSDSPYAANGPPITHPSAGLSYLRTKNYLDNHPIYGPQQRHPPVKARIVTPKNSAANYVAKIGVAGFISKIPEGETSFNFKAGGMYNKNSAIPGLNDFQPDVVGGSKVYVEPQKVTISSTGKVVLGFGATDPSAAVVQKEMVGEGVVFEDAVKETNEALSAQRPMLQRPWAARSRSIMGSSKTYGL
ncbi:hypothetical protein JX265_012988 [Neoarthrinium moseri]|uniref:Uncharacterized protein n=1 Tax=Neoarthrinium moseri TaxID=1658444 RepID=A0A9Q0AG97_9PEZI|nr:hypothetical protein JX266_004313 [Neoarthrinium moseri]KAI1852529.1 hypothetical protein JX265_012988 [Neoarthrinium moseri]